jgi:tetratricopeptide (TPR) repeat protein
MPAPGTLNVIGGNDRGKRFELTGPETRIGRGTDQDVVLSDIAVSRRHFTVVFDGARYKVRDLGSGNGTLVNGQRVDGYTLNDGDHIEIGQTVMRFEHQGSRPVAAPLPPLNAQPMPAQQPFGAPPPGMPVETPSDVALLPMNPGPTPYSTGQRSFSFLNPIDTPSRKLIAFGSMGLISLIGLIIIFSRTVFAKPPVVPSEAEELYRQGLRLYNSGDYEGAKISFGEALTQVPDSPDAKRYVRLCDAEVTAKNALKAAEQRMAAHKFVDALKALDQVDSASVSWDAAQKMRSDLSPRAATEDVEEARRIAADDPETARARLAQAIQLDPGNEDARTLLGKLKSGAALPPPVAVKEPEPPPEKEKPERAPPPEREHGKHNRHASRDDIDLAPVKVPPPSSKTPKEAPPPASSPGGAVSGSALAAYKNRDFAGAEKAYRVEALNLPAIQAQKSIEKANQVRQLKQVVDRASSEEGKQFDAAIKDYEEAMSLDGKLGKGMHAAFFKQKIGKMQQSQAQSAYAAGKYEQAFAAAQTASKYGAGDGGVLKLLEGKAGELVQKGIAVQKSNPPQAKTYWRTVIRMVPTTSVNYAKAYQLLNNGGGSHKDEDED